jgi:hypothetical protein
VVGAHHAGVASSVLIVGQPALAQRGTPVKANSKHGRTVTDAVVSAGCRDEVASKQARATHHGALPMVFQNAVCITASASL